jgi:hypothetical protein
MTDLRQKLDNLAASIADAAAQADTELQDRIDALKVLTPYYALLQKHPAGDPEGDELTFGDLQEQISNGAEVRPGRGGRSGPRRTSQA